MYAPLQPEPDDWVEHITVSNKLDEIALHIRRLTYGEMLELAEALWAQANGEFNEASIPQIFYRWSKGKCRD